MRTSVALGANLGDRLASLCDARQRIRRLRGVGEPWLNSPIYETEAVGCEAGAEPFLNAVVEFSFTGNALELLKGLRAIEASLGRQREHAPNESRTIDLDLLYSGEVGVDTPELQLPHPRLAMRRFVLQPLADIRPDLILPEQLESVSNLLTRLPSEPAVVRANEQW